MNIPIHQLKKWIAALDSGEYKQGVAYLQYGERYCCLGVACRVLISEKDLFCGNTGQIMGNMPAIQPHAPEWLVDISNDFRRKTGVGLEVLNDDRGYTFPEIATLLELVYIHKILD